MPDVKPEEGIAKLNDLFSQPDRLPRIDASNRAAVIGWGAMFNTIYFVDGIVRLHAAECCFAAAPLRRAAMEYAMWTVWLADAGDAAVEAMNKGLQYTQGKLVDGVDAASAVGRFPADAIQAALANKTVALPGSPDESLLNVKNLLDAYEPNTGRPGTIPLRLLYDTESLFSHATLTGTQLFYEATDTLTTFSLQPRFNEIIPCVLYGLSLQYTAMLAFNEMLAEKPWTDRLREVATTFGLDLELPKRRQKAAK